MYDGTGVASVNKSLVEVGEGVLEVTQVGILNVVCPGKAIDEALYHSWRVC